MGLTAPEPVAPGQGIATQGYQDPVLGYQQQIAGFGVIPSQGQESSPVRGLADAHHPFRKLLSGSALGRHPHPAPGASALRDEKDDTVPASDPVRIHRQRGERGGAVRSNFGNAQLACQRIPLGGRTRDEDHPPAVGGDMVALAANLVIEDLRLGSRRGRAAGKQQLRLRVLAGFAVGDWNRDARG